MMACLDTATLLDLAPPGERRARAAARKKVEAIRCRGEALVTTRLNVAELLVGVVRSKDPRTERRKVEALLRRLQVLELDARGAVAFGRIVGYLQEQGQKIGDMDALIASVCISHGHGVVTRNTRHFSRVPGLRVETY